MISLKKSTFVLLLLLLILSKVASKGGRSSGGRSSSRGSSSRGRSWGSWGSSSSSSSSSSSNSHSSSHSSTGSSWSYLNPLNWFRSSPKSTSHSSSSQSHSTGSKVPDRRPPPYGGPPPPYPGLGSPRHSPPDLHPPPYSKAVGSQGSSSSGTNYHHNYHSRHHSSTNYGYHRIPFGYNNRHSNGSYSQNPAPYPTQWGTYGNPVYGPLGSNGYSGYSPYGTGFGFGRQGNGGGSVGSHLQTFVAGAMISNLASDTRNNYQVFHNGYKQSRTHQNGNAGYSSSQSSEGSTEVPQDRSNLAGTTQKVDSPSKNAANTTEGLNEAKVELDFGNMTCLTIYNSKRFAEWANKTIKSIEDQTNQTFPFNLNLQESSIQFNFTLEPGKILHNETISITCCGSDHLLMDYDDAFKGQDSSTNCIHMASVIPFREIKAIPLNQTFTVTKEEIDALLPTSTPAPTEKPSTLAPRSGDFLKDAFNRGLNSITLEELFNITTRPPLDDNPSTLAPSPPKESHMEKDINDAYNRGYNSASLDQLFGTTPGTPSTTEVKAENPEFLLWNGQLLTVGTTTESSSGHTGIFEGNKEELGTESSTSVAENEISRPENGALIIENVPSVPGNRSSNPENSFSDPGNRFSNPDSNNKFSNPDSENRFSNPEYRISNSESRFSNPNSESRFSNPNSENRFSNPNSEIRFSNPNSENRFSNPNSENRFSNPNSDNRFSKPENVSPSSGNEFSSTENIPFNDASFPSTEKSVLDSRSDSSSTENSFTSPTPSASTTTEKFDEVMFYKNYLDDLSKMYKQKSPNINWNF